MRVVITSALTPPDHSGAGVAAVVISRGLVRMGLEVHLLTYSGESRTEKTGLHIHSLNRIEIGRENMTKALAAEGTNVVSSARQVLKLLRAIKPQLVHAVEPSTTLGLGAALAARRARIPFTMGTTLAESDDYASVRSKRFGAVRVYPFKIASEIIAISPRLEEDLCAVPEISHKVRLIPYPVEGDKYRPLPGGERSQLRVRLGMAPDAFVALSVGEVCDRKQQGMVVKAAHEVRQRYGHLVKVYLVGPYDEQDPYIQNLLQFIEEKGIEDQVVFLGYQPNVREWMQAADVFAFPSKREGFGIVYIEAMSTELPVVYAPLPGITDYIFRDKTGFCVENEAQMATVFHDLASNPALQNEIGQRARRSAIARFGIDEICRQYQAMFTRSISGA